MDIRGGNWGGRKKGGMGENRGSGGNLKLKLY